MVSSVGSTKACRGIVGVDDDGDGDIGTVAACDVSRPSCRPLVDIVAVSGEEADDCPIAAANSLAS
jgi:hypothetical protein